LKSHQALARLKVSQEEATEWLRERGARWFYVLGPTGMEPTGMEPTGMESTGTGSTGMDPLGNDAPAWRARMQFNGGEDPATGSAAGCAISYLAKWGAVTSGKRIHLRQGVEMGRPSNVYLIAHVQSGEVGDVRVGGSTVLVATGRLFLP
jgi:trans-2,3-dihydro-3-hydroxyanthranilate isomerase